MNSPVTNSEGKAIAELARVYAVRRRAETACGVDALDFDDPKVIAAAQAAIDMMGEIEDHPDASAAADRISGAGMGRGSWRISGRRQYSPCRA